MGMMEVDPTVRQTVSSLLSLVRIQSGAVVQALTSALETLAKVSEAIPALSPSWIEPGGAMPGHDLDPPASGLPGKGPRDGETRFNYPRPVLPSGA